MSSEQEAEQQELMDLSSDEQDMVDEATAQTVGGMGLMSRGI